MSISTAVKHGPPPNKKRRVDNVNQKQRNLTTLLHKDIVIYILSFLQYPKSIVPLSKTCTFFNELINNNPLCIKHYRLGIQYKFFKKIATLKNNNNNSNITAFFKKFSKLESLELLSMDPTLFTLLDIQIDQNVVKLFVKHILKPLCNKLTRLIVHTFIDSALSVDSFNFDNIKFINVKNVSIHGKDVKYPFHVTDYIPNIESLTLAGLRVVPYSLFRMLFDTKRCIKHLLQFHVYFFDICRSNALHFYDTKLAKLVNSNKLKVYDISELEFNQNGGKLQLLDYMWDRARSDYICQSDVVLLIIFHNRLTLQSLRINYEIFYNEFSLKAYGMENWNGIWQFCAKHQSKSIYLQELQNLSISISRLTTKHYQRINDDLLFYKLIVPKLRSIQIYPGICCWHNHNGFIPFLTALIGDQLYQLNSIQIISDDNTHAQRQYLQSSVEKIRRLFQRKNRTIHIVY